MFKYSNVDDKGLANKYENLLFYSANLSFIGKGTVKMHIQCVCHIDDNVKTVSRGVAPLGSTNCRDFSRHHTMENNYRRNSSE